MLVNVVTSERRGYKLLGLRGHKGGQNSADGTITVKRRGGTHKKSNIEKSVDGVSRARTLMLNDFSTNSLEEVEEPEETELTDQSEHNAEFETELALMEQVPMIPTYSHFGMFETKPVFTQMFGKLHSLSDSNFIIEPIELVLSIQLGVQKWMIYLIEW